MFWHRLHSSIPTRKPLPMVLKGWFCLQQPSKCVSLVIIELKLQTFKFRVFGTIFFLWNRFSEAEKTALRDGVAAYAREKGLSETDLSWLFKTSTGAQRELTRGAWKAIASECLPHRSIRAVHACGTRMLDPCNYKVLPTSSSYKKASIPFSWLQSMAVEYWLFVWILNQQSMRYFMTIRYPFDCLSDKTWKTYRCHSANRV